MTTIRRAEEADLPRIAAIQLACPEAAQWEAGANASYDVFVAEKEGRIAGFLAARSVAAGEHEILNLAVDPALRRCGVARRLLAEWLHSHPGAVYLEVRDSNQIARNLYKSMGFQEVGVRPKYYASPLEAAIVLKFHSC